MSVPKKPESAPEALPSIDTPEGRREIMKRAADGDKDVRFLTQDLFERDRIKGGNMMDRYGDSFSHAVTHVVKAVSGGNLMVEEGLLLKIRTLRDELAGSDPTPLERILCERVALTWFATNDADRRFSDYKDVSIKMAFFLETRRDKSHKRFLAACKTLATVRRLGNPSFQINQLVARQEVNLTGSV